MLGQLRGEGLDTQGVEVAGPVASTMVRLSVAEP